MTVIQEGVGSAGRIAHVRTALLVVAAGAGIGALTVGVISRAAMFLLIRLNPEADGVTSDDGFEMGRLTVSGSLNLIVVGLGLGVLSALFYLALERLRFGPAWFRTLSLSVGAGVVVGSLLVHPDGVDFVLLEPLALTVALFLAIPVLHLALLDLAVVRIREAAGRPAPSATGAVAWILRAGLAVLFVLAVASLVDDVRVLT